MNEKLSTLETNLAGLVKERDEALDSKAKTHSDLSARLAALEKDMEMKAKEAEELRRRQALQTLGGCFDLSTLRFIVDKEL